MLETGLGKLKNPRNRPFFPDLSKQQADFKIFEACLLKEHISATDTTVC
jgi:hypothetical protein